MELTIQVVAKHKKGFKARDTWYNSDKKADLSFADLHPGDVIDAEVVGDTFIKSFKLLGAQGAATSAPTSQPKTYTMAPAPNAWEDKREASIARAVALKAAVDAAGLSDEDRGRVKDLAGEFFDYLINGGWKEGK